VSTILGALKSLTRDLFFYSRLLPKVKRILFISLKFRHSLTITNYQKWGKTPYQNMSFLMEFNILIFFFLWYLEVEMIFAHHDLEDVACVASAGTSHF
jgi:hypothetical protein